MRHGVSWRVRVIYRLYQEPGALLRRGIGQKKNVPTSRYQLPDSLALGLAVEPEGRHLEQSHVHLHALRVLSADLKPLKPLKPFVPTRKKAHSSKTKLQQIFLLQEGTACVEESLFRVQLVPNSSYHPGGTTPPTPAEEYQQDHIQQLKNKKVFTSMRMQALAFVAVKKLSLIRRTNIRPYHKYMRQPTGNNGQQRTNINVNTATVPYRNHKAANEHRGKPF